MTHTIAKPTSFGAYPTVILSPDEGPLVVLELDLTFYWRRHAHCGESVPCNVCVQLVSNSLTQQEQKDKVYGVHGDKVKYGCPFGCLSPCRCKSFCPFCFGELEPEEPR